MLANQSASAAMFRSLAQNLAKVNRTIFVIEALPAPRDAAGRWQVGVDVCWPTGEVDRWWLAAPITPTDEGEATGDYAKAWSTNDRSVCPDQCRGLVDAVIGFITQEQKRLGQRAVPVQFLPLKKAC